MIEPKTLLVLPRLRVQNANAISGPLSWGFPAPTAFTGFVHALERRLSDHYRFTSVGIICHYFEEQAYKPNRRSHKVFALTRNPVGKDGGAPAIVEEGRAHMEISLLIGVPDYFGEDDRNDLAAEAQTVVQGMRIAGGSLLPISKERRFQCRTWPTDAESRRQEFRRLRRQLLPGSVLVLREDLLAQRLAELRQDHATANALDALLDLCCLHHEPPPPTASDEDEGTEGALEESASDEMAEESTKTRWTVRRLRPGWLVPLPIGYAGISELYDPGTVANARDPNVPFRFVESLYSLGEWVSPHRLDSLAALLWHTETDSDHGIYRCVNRYAETLPISPAQP